MLQKINYIKFHKRPMQSATIIFIVLLCALLSSCGNAKNATYFNGSSNMEYASDNQTPEPIIQKNDLLSITVSSANPEATQIFNVQNQVVAQSATNADNTTGALGYLVDKEGFIKFPILGNILAAGKAKSKLREEITQTLIDKKLLIEPIVDIRYLNYKVSVLGEVKNPSVLTIANEKISLLEALGMAGDITIYGRRDKVTLIREENGIKQMRKIDLTTNEIFSSPFYYLQSNDIIYVEPNKDRIASSSIAIQWIPVILSAISLGIIAVFNTN